MKKRTKTMMISIISAVILFIGPAIPLADQQSATENSDSAMDVKKETLEAVEALQQYSIEKKDRAVKEVKAMMDKLDDHIGRMQNRIEKKWDEMDQASREKTRETLQVLRQKRNELSEWYGGMKHSSAEAWEQVKKGFAKSYEALADAFDKAEDELNAGK